MYIYFKNIAVACDYTFEYGKGHWQNCVDYEDDSDKPFEKRKVHLKLFWCDIEKKFNEYGALDATFYEGMFILCVRSNVFDKDYNYKYENNIKPLLDSHLDKICQFLSQSCDFIIQSMKIAEVENQMDNNFDGLRVDFKIKKV